MAQTMELNAHMSSKVNKELPSIPEHLKYKGFTPSGKPRLFVCQTCTRAFARQEHLTRHERSHTKEKPYCCGICDRRFTRRDLLLRHAHKVHGGNCGESLLRKKRSKRMSSKQMSNSNGPLQQSPGSLPTENHSNDKIIANGDPLVAFEAGSTDVNSRKRKKKNEFLERTKKMATPTLMRRASFSAQSAENYAKPLGRSQMRGPARRPSSRLTNVSNSSSLTNANAHNSNSMFPELNTHHPVDNVEFSTPQLLPVDFGNALTFNEMDFFSLDEENEGSVDFSIEDFNSFQYQGGENNKTLNEANNGPHVHNKVDEQAVDFDFLKSPFNKYNDPLSSDVHLDVDDKPRNNIPRINENSILDQFHKNLLYSSSSNPEISRSESSPSSSVTMPNELPDLNNHVPITQGGAGTPGYSPFSVNSFGRENTSQKSKTNGKSSGLANNNNNILHTKSLFTHHKRNNESLKEATLSGSTENSPHENGYGDYSNVDKLINTTTTPGFVATSVSPNKISSHLHGQHSDYLPNEVDSNPEVFDDNISPKQGDYNTKPSYIDNIQKLTSRKNSLFGNIYNKSPAEILRKESATPDTHSVTPQYITEINEITSFNKDLQSIFNDFMKEEEKDIIYGKQNGDLFNLLVNGESTKTTNNLGGQLQTNFSEIENLSGNGSIHDANNNYTFYGLDYLGAANITKSSPPESGSNMKRCKLFTTKLRILCHSALKFYDLNCSNSTLSKNSSDTMLFSKQILLPSANELNECISLFQENFLSHHPFIHQDILNLDIDSLRKYVYENEEFKSELDDCWNIDFDGSTNVHDIPIGSNKQAMGIASLVCLPLFMATCGSIYKNDNNFKTMELYEASRRVLHVYLETKKQEQISIQKDPTVSLIMKRKMQNQQHHVWLIQSLILSIIFAFFADYLDTIDTQLVVRQVAAICSIIKSNILADITYSSNQTSSFDSSFKYILYETKIRTVLMAYKFSQLLTIYYNMDCTSYFDEHTVEQLTIPDDEYKWQTQRLFQDNSFIDANVPMTSSHSADKSSAINLNQGSSKSLLELQSGGKYQKQHTVSFKQFYDSFAFNNRGLHAIPEYLAINMVLYEYSIRNHSKFHVFLTRLDNKKLEANIPAPPFLANEEQMAFSGKKAKILIKDAIALRNYLMSMKVFNDVDKSFANKICKTGLKEIFYEFLYSDQNNLLTHGSYNLMTDFLIALNFAIKNLTRLVKYKRKGSDELEFDKNKFSIFNLQAYYYDFLTVIKFIMDFERTPNFKLLSIFTELRKLADCVFIPLLNEFYSIEFTQYTAVIPEQSFNNKKATDDLPHILERLEKMIGNVLVYSFNDNSFLNMFDDKVQNEFQFNPMSNLQHFLKSPKINDSQLINSNRDDGQKEHINNGEPFDDTSINHTKSSVNLVLRHQQLQQQHAESTDSDSSLRMRTHKQGFAERYQLSAKFASIGKCVFKLVKEDFCNAHILDKMSNDYSELCKLLEKEVYKFDLSGLEIDSRKDNPIHYDVKF